MLVRILPPPVEKKKKSSIGSTLFLYLIVFFLGAKVGIFADRYFTGDHFKGDYFSWQPNEAAPILTLGEPLEPIPIISSLVVVSSIERAVSPSRSVNVLLSASEEPVFKKDSVGIWTWAVQPATVPTYSDLRVTVSSLIDVVFIVWGDVCAWWTKLLTQRGFEKPQKPHFA